jgi:hypothetical protein
MNQKPNEPSTAQPLSDSEARDLLARATAIEAAGAGHTVAELREAAEEAGIDRRAFDRAIGELHAMHPAATKPVPNSPTLGQRLRASLLETGKIVGVVVAVLLILMLLVDLIG